jgi:hypothetical protein
MGWTGYHKAVPRPVGHTQGGQERSDEEEMQVLKSKHAHIATHKRAPTTRSSPAFGATLTQPPSCARWPFLWSSQPPPSRPFDTGAAPNAILTAENVPVPCRRRPGSACGGAQRAEHAEHYAEERGGTQAAHARSVQGGGDERDEADTTGPGAGAEAQNVDRSKIETCVAKLPTGVSGGWPWLGSWHV